MKLLQISLLATLLLAIVGSCHLDPIGDCDLSASFRFEQTSDSTFAFINESDAGAGISYSWNFNDGPLVSAASPSHNFSKPGTYFVTLTAMQGDCFGVFQDTVIVEDGGPVAQFNVNASCFEVNCPISFVNTSLNAVRWKWDFGDPDLTTDTDTSKNPTWTYTRAGTYRVQLTAYTAGNADSSVSQLRDVVITAPTFMKTFTVGANPASEQEAVVGIDQAVSGEYFIAVCNGKACYFPKASATGTVGAANAVTPGVFSSIYINNFKKFSSGYVLVGEASAGAITAGYAYRLNSSFQFQSKDDLHISTEQGIDVASDVALTDASTYLFCGFALDRPDSNGMYLVNTSASLLENWHRYLFHKEPGAWARAILNVDDGYLIAGYKKNGSTNEACFFSLKDNLSVTTNTNMFWGATDFYIDDILPLQNGFYALVGNNITSGNGWIRVVNSSGTKSWDQEFSGIAIRQAVYTAAGRLIIVGKLANKAVWADINPLTGAMIGTAKSYLPSGFVSAEATCVAATADGGFILGGNAKNSGNLSSNLLIKLNQNGEQ